MVVSDELQALKDSYFTQSGENFDTLLRKEWRVCSFVRGREPLLHHHFQFDGVLRE